MTLTNLLYNIIIAPIELIIEFIFCFYNTKIGVAGIMGAIVAVSLAVNFLALPLYNIADSLQEKERNIQLSLSKWVKHIKKNFKGDERFMMLQAYYRENNYHPLYALRSSLSILIEIPFFIAAYQFLSHSTSLQGAVFAFLHDLGAPDGLAKISMGGIRKYSINLLPILMTLINFVSGAIYLKKAPLKEKIQLYALALVFLFILYDSPSGLVCYWILNNTFSLFKNLVNTKVKNPHRLVHLVISGILLVASVFILFRPNYKIIKRLALLAFSLTITFLPFAINLTKKIFNKLNISSQNHNTKFITISRTNKTQFSIFIFSAIGLALLAGFLLPSGIIATSPAEFAFVGNTDSPISYIWSNLSFFIGLFLFWPFAIYKMFGEKVQKILSPLWALFFLTALFNVYVFKYEYGNFSIFFKLNEAKCLKDYSTLYTILPVITSLGIIAIFFAIRKFNLQKYAATFLFVLCFAELALGIKNTTGIKKEFARFAEIYRENSEQEIPGEKNDKIEPVYHLSRTKQNVVVLFLDKAVSSFLPYIVKEFPEMEEQFSGFTYYPNTVSFSNHTLKGSPAMMGGYEYTPENANKRKDISLREKHNEATLLLPKLFLDVGFDVTVTDPPSPNYSWKGDFSAFKKYPEIHVSEQIGKYKNKYLVLHPELEVKDLDICVRGNLQSFTLLEILPPIFRYTYYYGGNYYHDLISKKLHDITNDSFLANYTTLYFMNELTDAENTKSAYIFICNETPHDYTLLENKTYRPAINLNENLASSGFYNYKYKPSSDSASDLASYHVNTATLLQVAKWLDYLKNISVYDNTRIIIVADHGAELSLPPFRRMKYGEEYASYNPLFLYKDFNAKGNLKTDNTFMTNADTIFLATKNLGLTENNPFTGNALNDFNKKDVAHIYETIREDDFAEWNPSYLLDTKLWVLKDKKYHTPSYTVHDNIFDESNWEKIVK